MKKYGIALASLMLLGGAFCLSANAQRVISNNSGSSSHSSKPSTANVVNPSKSSVEDDGPLSAVGLHYFSFDGVDNWGLGVYGLNPDGFGMDLLFRANLSESHGNFNADFGANYSFQVFNENNRRVLLTLAAGPTLRMQDEFDGIDNKGNIKWNTCELFLDAFINPRVTVYLNKFSLTAGYYYWAPQWKFSKDDGATGGFSASIGYDF